jgi:HAE1 family hydrophobic/amphiphilic exporter-1
MSIRLIAAAAALSLLAVAQEEPLPTERVGVSLTETKLTLADAVKTALENNLEIEIERTNPIIASLAVKAALGSFDPTFHYAPSFQNNNTPTSSSLTGINGLLTEQTNTQNVWLNWKTPFQGSSVALDFENNRQVTNSPFAGLTPFFNSRLVLSYTQPLWRNRAIDQARNDLRIRRKNLSISDLDFKLRVIDVVSRVETAYWDLVAARQDVTVTHDAVGLAGEQYARNQRMIASGSLAPVELSASKAELERRRDAYFASLGTVTEVENTLKSLLAPNRASLLWNDQIIPLDLTSRPPSVIVDVRSAVSDAIQDRPELKQALLRQQANAYDQQYAADQAKPQVNLIASYTNSGLAGAINTAPNPFNALIDPIFSELNLLSAAAGLPVVPPLASAPLPNSVIGGYGTALSSVFGGNYQSASVGVQFDLTLRNRSAQAFAAQTAVTGKRLKLEQAQIEQAVEVQVRNALQAIQTARQRISAAEASEAAAKEKLESETRLFQTGESTNFLVLTRQGDYLDARRRTVVARLESNRATARLEQALGTTLSTYHVTLK